MKKWTGALLGLVAATLWAGSALQAASKEEMIKAAEGVDQAFLKAFNEGNVDAISALYWKSPDVLLFPPDAMMVKGSDSLRNMYVQFLATMKGCRLEMKETHQMPVGEVVLGWGLWRLTMPAPDSGSAPIEMLGRYTDVKAERDGKWVYLMDHASVPVPPDAGKK
jgi:ketosteroid isomerase-like protein